MAVAGDRDLRLHVREHPTEARPFWSRDDAKFLLAAPLLFGAALLGPQARWHGCARLIESLDGCVRADRSPPPALDVVARRLGITPAELQRMVAASRVNQTDHLIHVAHGLLRKTWRPRFSITGLGHLDAALAQRRGVVLWVAHFSFSSLYTKMALADAGYSITHISRPEHGVSKSRFGIKYLNGLRCAVENRHLHRRIVHRRDRPGDTRQAALAALRANQLLSITVGAWEGRHLATGELLGSSCTVSTGAPGLAFAGGARLLPIVTIRDSANGEIHVAIGEPLGETARSSREEFVYACTQELLAGLEAAIRIAPEQWRGWSKLLGSRSTA